MRKILMVVGIILVLATPSLYAQTYRKEAAVSPVYIYQQMLSYAEKGEFKKISKSLTLLEEILAAIKSKFNKDLKALFEEALTTNDTKEIKKAIYALIFYDIKDVFGEVLSNLNTKGLYDLKETLRFAYLDYLLISPVVKKKNFEVDRRIRKTFNEVLGGLLARAFEEKNPSLLRGKLARIEESYKLVLDVN